MNRQRNPRPSGRDSGAPRIRPTRATSAPTRAGHRPTGSASAEGAVLVLLSELLIGDSAWTMAQVQRLVSMRDLAELGRWRVAGLDDEGASAR
jgi:hypothetical protein